MATKVYQYSKCSTCRNALRFLDKKGVTFQAVEITEKPPTKTELKQMLKSYGGDVRKLFNTSGQLYREMKLKDKLSSFTESQAIDLLSKNGMLVKRPFLLTGSDNLVGFREAEWKKVF